MLKRLPKPKEGVKLTPEYYLRVGVVRGGEVVKDRDEFKEVAAGLYPSLAAARVIYKEKGITENTGTQAVKAIRGDYRLINARRWLELTESKAAARKLLEVVGDGRRLQV